MSTGEPPYDWRIDEATQWPPRSRPRPPFGVTILEVVRACPLRSCFEASSGYERRLGYAARVGIAFHTVLQSLGERPPAEGSPAELAAEARRRFEAALARQEALRTERPRERGLPRDEARVTRAIEALIVEAQRVAGTAPARPGAHSADEGFAATAAPEAEPTSVTESPLEIEQPVGSKDALFQGRVDCAVHVPEGTTLVDYKSALRDDLPERYERQLQLYALLWYETRGEWPAQAEVVYPFTGTVYPVDIDPKTCKRVADEYRTLVTQLQTERSAQRLASPGEVCQVCEFRPWCKPFWAWQAAEPSQTVALERAYWGFEGEVASVERIEQHWKLLVRWRGGTVRIMAAAERLPQLAAARAGMRARALEMRLHGLRHAPQAIVTAYSELFLVE